MSRIEYPRSRGPRKVDETEAEIEARIEKRMRELAYLSEPEEKPRGWLFAALWKYLKELLGRFK